MKVYLSLGANLGNRGETLREALRRLACLPWTKLVKTASFYETAPWGKLDQPRFINTVAAIETELSPTELLQYTQQIETDLGRVRHEHWGARTIDIDLLWADGIKLTSEVLKLPHPYASERAFVLMPWRELAPELVLAGKSINDWCNEPVIAKQKLELAAEINKPYPLNLIACIDKNRGLGLKGRLLKSLPEDMARFKKLTLGNVVIMGRKTMESLPQAKPLAERINIVLTATITAKKGFIICHNINELWQKLGEIYKNYPEKTSWCIGGGKVYAELLPYVQTAYITELAEAYPADVILPVLTDFRLQCHEQSKNCEFKVYQREQAEYGDIS